MARVIAIADLGAIQTMSSTKTPYDTPSHLLEAGADLPTLQLLLGHVDLKATSIYLHLSARHLKTAGTPLDKLEVSSPEKVKRSRKLHKR